MENRIPPIKERVWNDYLILEMPPSLTIFNSELYKEKFTAILGKRKKNVLLDMAQVAIGASAIMSLLIELLRQANQEKVRLYLVNVSTALEEALRVSSINKIIEVYRSIHEFEAFAGRQTK